MKKKLKRLSETSTVPKAKKPLWKALDINQYRTVFIKAGLRRLSYRWYPRAEAMKEARLERGIYRCNACEGSFRKAEVQLDHVTPVVDPSSGFTTWDAYILALLPNRFGFQVLCRGCHKEKTGRENRVRRDLRLAKKSGG